MPSECSNSSSASTFTFTKALWSFMFPLKLLAKTIRIFRKACNSSFSFSTRLDMLVKPRKKKGIPRRIRFELYSHFFQKMNTMVANCFWTAQNYTQNRTTKCQFCPWCSVVGHWTVLGLSTTMEQSHFCIRSIYAEYTRKSSSLHFYGRLGSLVRSLARPAILPAVGDLRNTANKNGNLFPRFIFCLTLKVLMHRHFATLPLVLSLLRVFLVFSQRDESEIVSGASF